MNLGDSGRGGMRLDVRGTEKKRVRIPSITVDGRELHFRKEEDMPNILVWKCSS